MKSSFFALVSTALVALASAWTTPVGDTPQGNPIAKPGLNELVPAGSPYTITWDPTTTGTVTILLLRGPSTNVVPLYAIVEKTPNTGTFVWTPSTDLEADTTGYGLQLIDDATGFYQYSTQFGISNSVVASSSSSSSSSTPLASSTTSASSISSTVVTSSATSSTISIVSSSTITSSVPSSTSVPVTIEDATTVVHTNIVTITSCGPTVTDCPAHKPTSVPVPVPSSSSSLTYWSNSTLATVTPTKSIASTGFAVSATATPSQFTGAGEKIRVGCAMGAVFVAALALAL